MNTLVPKIYQAKTGRYKGKWHVRLYGNKRYFHVGRFDSEMEAIKAAQGAV